MDPLIFRAGEKFRRGSGYTIEQEAAVCGALCEFLTTNALNTRALPSKDTRDWSSFELRFSDVTEEGLATIKAALDKWMRGIDGGKDPYDTRALTKALDQVRRPR